jgi:hypothetical protein
MAGIQFLYGLHYGELVHVDEVNSGKVCECVCLQCKRPLIARKGPKLRAHFQHAATEVACNPTPESLVHRYAKEQIAKRQRLRLPGFLVESVFQSEDGVMHTAYKRFHPYYERVITHATVEEPVQSYVHNITVQPDVLIYTSNLRLAVEVYFRHAVPEDKCAKLEQMALSAVEVDMSDLSTTAPAAEINAAINDAIDDLSRWRWLCNRDVFIERAPLDRMLSRSHSIFRPKAPAPAPTLTKNIGLPSRKLADAEKMLARAEQLRVRLKTMSPDTAIDLVRELGIEMRVALHCSYLGIRPLQLPLNLMQKVDGQSSIGMHPVQWQTGVFLKFCMRQELFDVWMVERWVRTAFRCDAFTSHENLTWSANQFSLVHEAIYHFLRNLAAQGLLYEEIGRRPWESKFAALGPREAINSRLHNLPPAVSGKALKTT